MAYFSNGSEGEIFDNQCAECLHQDEETMCPIAFVQTHFNYDQLSDGQEKLREAVTMLVDEKGNCRMKPLIDKYLPDPRQQKMF